VYSDLDFEIRIRVKVTADLLNDDNICTKLNGNSPDTKCYIQTDGQTYISAFLQSPFTLRRQLEICQLYI